MISKAIAAQKEVVEKAPKNSRIAYLKNKKVKTEEEKVFERLAKQAELKNQLHRSICIPKSDELTVDPVTGQKFFKPQINKFKDP
jgi:hypothetical protein